MGQPRRGARARTAATIRLTARPGRHSGRKMSLVVLLFCTLLAACGRDDRTQVYELGTDAEIQGMHFRDAQNGWLVGGGFLVNGGASRAASWRTRGAFPLSR